MTPDLREVLKDVRWRAATRKPVYQVNDEWTGREQAYNDLVLLINKLEESLEAIEENVRLKERIEEIEYELQEKQEDASWENTKQDASPCVCDRDSW